MAENASASPLSLESLRVDQPARVDDRWRMSLPDELHDIADAWGQKARLVKQEQGALALWPPPAGEGEANRQDEVDRAIQRKLAAREDRPTNQALLREVIKLARLRSTRESIVHFETKCRLTIPKPFRAFLGIEPKSDVIVVASAVCIEIWHPERWREFVDREMGELGAMVDSALGS